MSEPADALLERLQPLLGREVGPVYGWDPVNAPMIRHWCEAMGIDNPIYLDEAAATQSVHGGPVAPPTMLQVWMLAGLSGKRPHGSSEDDPYLVLKELDEAGYRAVVAVNCEQSYDRYLRPGDRLSTTSMIEDVSPRKQTALGVGYFVTELMTFRDADGERIGTMRWRLFKYQPHEQPKPAAGDAMPAVPRPRRPQPAISDDTRFFWDGLKARKLLIQKCTSCGTLRHPPGPSCPACHSFAWETIEASGQGTLHSYVVFHYPEIPPFAYPNPIGLVELAEGTRLVAGLVGIRRDEIAIGMPLIVDFIDEDGLTLPVFRSAR